MLHSDDIWHFTNTVRGLSSAKNSGIALLGIYIGLDGI